MLEKVNLETVTLIEVDGESIFKYFFLTFGASVRGLNYMRKVIGIDETFLKGPYKGDIDELVFVSDRAQSIKNVVSTVFNNA